MMRVGDLKNLYTLINQKTSQQSQLSLQSKPAYRKTQPPELVLCSNVSSIMNREDGNPDDDFISETSHNQLRDCVTNYLYPKAATEGPLTLAQQCALLIDYVSS